MTRKMTNFDLRVYPVGGKEGTYNHQMLSDEIRTQYIEQGWEVFETEVAQIVADTIYIKIVLVKYEEVPDALSELVATQSVAKRGPGRPPKVAEEVVAN